MRIPPAIDNITCSNGTSSFSILFVLFVACIELNEVEHLNAWEVLFMIYSLGFSLEKVAAMQEHGVKGTVCSHQACQRLLTSAFAVYFSGIWVGDVVDSRLDPAHHRESRTSST